MSSIQIKLLAGVGFVLLLLGVYFQGRSDGKEAERESWQKGVEITLQAYSSASEQALDSQQKLQKLLSETTKKYVERTEKYYETNTDDVCLDESRSVYVREGRRSITSDGGS